MRSSHRFLQGLMAAVVASGLRLHSQLAITEVQSNASVAVAPAAHADWWELTNYGSTAVDLTGWLFNDSTGGTTNGAVTLQGLSIAPGESVIFVEGLEPSTFRSWWGAAVGESVQVVSYTATGIGLSSGGDGLRLWNPGTGSGPQPVLSVDFGASGTNTASFVPDAISGLLTARAAVGIGGAARAADGNDVASPGVAPAPIAVSVASLSPDVEVAPGASTTLTVEATGLPRPSYQWFRGGQLLEGAISPSLVLTNFSAGLAGSYSVRLDNGQTNLRSQPVQVRLAEAPAAPTFTSTFQEATVFAGSSVRLAVEVAGVPRPTLVWRQGDTVLDVAGTELVLASITTNQSGTYSVTATNPSGSVRHAAQVTVLARPDIRFTEVSSARTVLDPGFIDRNGFGPEDWWELTSFAPVPVSLTGWRFDDNSASLAAAITLTNADLVIRPGESVVFVERLTADQFRTWWGTNGLPAGLQVVTYTGSGIGLSSAGDGLRLWNATATLNSDTIASVDFPAGEPGVSFNYDPDTGVFGALSLLGVHGVYQAPGTLEGVVELGSPGRIREGSVVLPPTPPTLSARVSGDTLRIAFQAEAGRTYRLQARATLGEAWVSLGSPLSPASAGEATFTATLPATAGSGFYRVLAE